MLFITNTHWKKPPCASLQSQQVRSRSTTVKSIRTLTLLTHKRLLALIAVIQTVAR